MLKTNLENYKKCLIIVDMVNGFVREGVLHDKEIEKIIPRQVELIEENLKEGNLVIFIKDTHDENSVEFQRFGNTTHCLRGTSESKLVDEIKVFEGLDNTISFEKNSTSFMEVPELRMLMGKLTGLQEVNIVGCCTDICVINGAISLSNYFNQYNRDVEMKIHEDAIETYDSPSHDRDKYTNAAKLLMEQQGMHLVRKR